MLKVTITVERDEPVAKNEVYIIEPDSMDRFAVYSTRHGDHVLTAMHSVESAMAGVAELVADPS